MKSLLNKLIYFLVERCKAKGHVYHITGTEDQKDDVYLVRYIVLKSRFMCIYIHRFMRSDSSDPHDHPWNFLTYIVSGGYEEHFYDINQPVKGKKKYLSFWTKKVNVRKPGSLAYRRATDIHRVVIPRKYTLAQIEQAPLTACIMFNRIRHWGFWPLADKGAKFIDWRSYLNIKTDDPRITGSE